MTSPNAELHASLQLLDTRLASVGFRTLLWCDAPSDETIAALLAHYGERALWVSPQQPEQAPQINWIQPGQAQRRLGEETDAVLFDARQGMDADAFGALSGTLKAGGVFTLITSHVSFIGRSGKRMQRLLEQSSAIARLRSEGQLDLPSFDEAPEWQLQRDEEGCLSSDQRQAVTALASLKRRRPLVLTADRGRGKSAAMGMAAAQRLREKGGTLLVTAPAFASVESLFRQLEQHAPEGQREGHNFLHPNGELRFLDALALQQALQSAHPPGGDGSMLLVDEAAALPVQLLKQCVERFPRIAFATTTHGYEGSGRGFAIRFRDYLDQRTPDRQTLTLNTPVRWAQDDPLEALTNQLLCLNGEVPEGPLLFDEVRIERIDRDRLAASDAALNTLFGLLVTAHYRTAPSDLTRLLDQRPISIWIARDNTQLLGVCASVDEGGYTPDMAEAVTRGERRLPGELLPQSLALHEGLKQAAQLRWRRIMRIAVHPAAQRRGIARKLIDAVALDAASKGVALLGASFGAEAGLMHFWSRLACLPLRLGLRAERSSGENAVMVGRALNAEGASLIRQCRQHWALTLEERLAMELRELDVALVDSLLTPEAIPSSPELVSALKRLAQAHAPLTPYRTLLKSHWGSLREHLDSDARQGFLGLLYQGKDERWLARRFEQTGRAAGETLWREWCAQMLKPVQPEES
ncbi:GNAT family N-acetyltransferase [Carnimonas nigrificans]|uniref:GNAT family N-acetyltransferase n=1 Tax=Carnimonas nigrificans TaxID=64323 RepID=UPI0004729E33|nr:GNAT family N-acetyltransferase [Carnimonas nigrificans]